MVFGLFCLGFVIDELLEFLDLREYKKLNRTIIYTLIMVEIFKFLYTFEGLW